MYHCLFLINNYNNIMFNYKKLLVLILCFIIVSPVQAAFWNKKSKAMEAELQGKGYDGTLPNLDKNIKAKTQQQATPIFESQKGFDNSADLKPIPDDNPAFVNIIQKKDKPLEYTLDIKELVPFIEKLVDCIEDEGSVQLFITRANSLVMYLNHFQEKYDGKTESASTTYQALTELNQHVKTVALLRQEAVTYQRYLAYQASGSIYNPENINQQLNYLKEELNSAVVLIRKNT